MKTLDSNDRRGKFHQTFKKQITPNQTVPGNREKKKSYSLIGIRPMLP